MLSMFPPQNPRRQSSYPWHCPADTGRADTREARPPWSPPPAPAPGAGPPQYCPARCPAPPVELQTKVKRRFAKISQSRIRPLLEPFLGLKQQAPTSAFTFKTVLRHYAKHKRHSSMEVDMKLGCKCKGHKRQIFVPASQFPIVGAFSVITNLCVDLRLKL